MKEKEKQAPRKIFIRSTGSRYNTQVPCPGKCSAFIDLFGKLTSFDDSRQQSHLVYYAGGLDFDNTKKSWFTANTMNKEQKEALEVYCNRFPDYEVVYE